MECKCGYGDTWFLPGCQASLRKSCSRGGVGLDSWYYACIRVSTGVCPRFSKMVLKRTGQPYVVVSSPVILLLWIDDSKLPTCPAKEECEVVAFSS
ncbi:hypothetical protein AVEN_58232-1 [Araneus ventricosus]|uniref:Uncharacterized protein n=1 Tax=Araneus ventricosus TaxID=182803 RepID=A0A4Y2JP93_ARAVE|nr:hypothetical protein AVEN_58232-1 [Araneus ventricosus]